MGILTIVFAVVMLGSLVGMLAINKKVQARPDLKPLAFVLLLVIFGSGFGLLYDTGMLREMGLDFGFNEKKLSADVAIYASQADMLAPVLKDRQDQKILLLYSAGFENSQEYINFVDRLIANGIAAENIVGAAATDAPPAAEGALAMPQRLSAALLNKAASSHNECKTVITMNGVPGMEAGALNCITKRYSASAQQWVLLEPNGGSDVVQYGMANGNVLAAVSFCDRPVGEIASVPEDPAEVFALRYVLVKK